MYVYVYVCVLCVQVCAWPPSVSRRDNSVVPVTKCRLRKLRMERVKDYLLLEQEFIANQEAFKPSEEKTEVSQPFTLFPCVFILHG